MTYESPITLIKTRTDNFIKEINDKTDEVIFKAVVNVLPQVDKEELIKALAYDREQYSKGYKDRDSEIVRCKDCRHGEHIQNPIWGNRDIDKAPSQFHDFIKCHKFHIKGFNETLYLGDDDYCSHGERKEK